MDLSKRLVHVKSSAKEKDYPSFTPEDILFLFEDITHPEGLVLNHSDPSECFVLFSATAPITEIYRLNDSSSWVGVPMLLSVRQPCASIYSIVMRLLEDKALEEGEKYEYIPIEPVEPKGDGVPQPHSTPRKKAEPIATVLVEQFKQLESQDLQQILSATQTEMRSRQDFSISPAHEVSSILQTLLKDGALRTNVPKLSALVGKGLKERSPLSSEAMSSKLSGRPTVILH